MKKFLTLFAAALMTLAVNAQMYQGDISAGVALLYGSEIENVGIGARFNYTVIDHLRTEANLNFFFKKHDTRWADINLNAEWLVPLKEDVLFVYPIAGLNYTMVNFKHTDPVTGNKHNDEENHVGLNLGAGMQFNVTSHIGVTLEYRHTIIRKVDQGVFGLGVNYKF